MVSSAYCKELQLMLPTMSAMYRLKSTGPNMLPCGTPKFLSCVDEVLPLICAGKVYFIKFLKQSKMVSSIKRLGEV